jgi:hypothetical protein
MPRSSRIKHLMSMVRHLPPEFLQLAVEAELDLTFSARMPARDLTSTSPVLERTAPSPLAATSAAERLRHEYIDGPFEEHVARWDR